MQEPKQSGHLLLLKDRNAVKYWNKKTWKLSISFKYLEEDSFLFFKYLFIYLKHKDRGHNSQGISRLRPGASPGQDRLRHAAIWCCFPSCASRAASRRVRAVLQPALLWETSTLHRTLSCLDAITERF